MVELSEKAESITQKYLRRWPDSKLARSWAGRMVHIQTDNGVWRKGGSGYTYAGQPDAWVLPFEDAQRQVAHCGPEKRATFIAVQSALPAPDDGLVERLKAGSIALKNDRPASSSIMEEAATALQSQAEQIERLTRERDEWRGHVQKQNENVAHNLCRAETAEQQVQKITAENERLREALVRSGVSLTMAGYSESASEVSRALETQEGGK